MSVALVALAASFLVGPALLHPSGRVAGERSDPAAEVWHFEEMASGRLGLFQPTTTPMVNAPDGARLRRPVEVTTLFIDVVAWPLGQVTDAASVRNLMLLIGVMSNGIAMLIVASVLRMHWVAAVVGALVFMYAPPLVIEARLHVALVYVFTVPLAYAAGIRLQRRCDLQSGALLGLTVGLSCYINPYLPLYAGATAACVSIVVLVQRRVDALAPLLVATATTALAAAPALVLLIARRTDTIASVRRSIAEINVYATTPLDMAQAFGPWPLGVAVFAISLVFLSRATEPAVRTTSALIAVAGVLLAAGTQTTVVGIGVPLPNRVLFAIYPAWRVVGRAAILVWFVVALALALGATSIAHHAISRGVGHVHAKVVALALATMMILGGSWRHGRPWFPVDETPALSSFLSSRPGTLAEYPLFGLDHHESGPYLLRQTVHERPLMNGNMPGTVGHDVSQVASRIDDPQAHAGLVLAGVRTVVVHGDGAVPTWGRYLDSLDGAQVFDLGSMADPAILSWRGAYEEEASGTHHWRWLSDSTVAHVTSARPGVFRVRVEVVTMGAVRALQIGSTRVDVGPVKSVAEFCVASREQGPAGLFVGAADVVADAPAEVLGPADQRRAIARVENARVVGRCGE